MGVRNMKRTLFIIIATLLFTGLSCHSEKYDDELISKFFININQLFDQIDEAIQKRPYKRISDIITEEKKATFPECRNELITPAMKQNTWFKEQILPIQEEIVKKHHEILKAEMKQSNREKIIIAAAISEKYLEHYQLITKKLDLINDETIKTNNEFKSRLSELNDQNNQIKNDIRKLEMKLKDHGVNIKS